MLLRGLVFSLVSLVLTSPSFAQGVGVGSITGIASDSSGAVIAGVQIDVRNIATGVIISATSNPQGNYLIPNLIPGLYELTAAVQGFKKYVRTGLQVQVGETLRIDPALEVGNVTESVQVSAAAPLVQTESGSRGEVLDNRQITQLPLSGRNVYNLTALVPGSAPDNSGRVRINGARARSNEFLVDGVTQVNPETRADPIAPPPVDSIEEVKVFTNSYAAEYGNAAGGLVNVATKSGTNEYHVTLWEFLRNDALNTRNFFAPPTQKKPVLRQNQFGAAGGGPVSLPGIYDGRNRTFFFADYEGWRVRRQSVFNVTVPTVSMRAGDLSSLLGPVIGTDSLGREVRQGQIYDPFSERSANGVLVRDPVVNNILTPALRARLDPAATRALTLYPSPTEAGLNAQNFRRATSTGDDWNRFDLRLDHIIASKHRIFGRYSDYSADSLPNAAFSGAQGDFQTNANKQRSVTASWTGTFASNLLNEFRFAWLDRVTNREPYLAGRNVASDLGIPGIATEAGVPNIDISGFQALGGNFSGGYLIGEQQVYSLINHVAIITGRHSLKIGAEARLYRLENFQPNMLNGSFTFRPDQTALPGSLQGRTGNAFASFLFGLANQTQYTQKDPGQQINGDTYAAFIQDDFKLARRLTLNLGIRYDVNTRLREIRDLHSSFDLGTARVIAGKGKPEVSLDRNNFAPRIGFALDVTGNQQTVVRGGYGIFYQPIVGSGGNPLGGVPKFPFEFTSNAVSIGVSPVTTLSAGPVLQQEFQVDDPRLGFGTNVQIQSSNLAPYVQQWNLGVEHAIGGRVLAGVAYVGSAGKKLESGRNGTINLNQVRIEDVQRASAQQNTLTPDTSRLRPYPNFNEVQSLLTRYGDSNYHSLQAKAESRMSGGLTFLLSYTWSKSIDNASEIFNFTGGSYPQDVYNLAAERAVSTADVPHRFSGAYVWDVPVGRGRAVELGRFADALLGGWQLNGITTLSSGRPVEVEQASNTSRTFSQLQRPNISGNPALSREERTLDRFFDTSVFSAAMPLTFGTSPRNPIRGPGLVNFDLAVVKQWKLGEKRAIEFRGESFNLSNTPQFILDTRTSYNPSVPLAQQSFGRITSARDGRVIQLALKLRL